MYRVNKVVTLSLKVFYQFTGFAQSINDHSPHQEES